MAVEATGLVKRYGPTLALESLDLRVAAGEVYGLLGLNGAGKSTTVRILTGLARPDGGRALVDGVDVARDPAALKGRIGLVTESNLAGEPAWSAWRYLRHFALVHGLSRGESDARIRGLLSALDLAPHAEKPLRALSGGNRRKVELARALLARPRVLFLDEPTRELDIPTKRATWTFLRGLAREGTTVFVSSHDAQEIATLCTRIGVLRRGRLAWEGRPADLTVGERSLVDALAAALEGREAPAAAARAAPVPLRVLVSPKGDRAVCPTCRGHGFVRPRQ